jgi:hypothetical protein
LAIDYLDGQPWDAWSREERLFCAVLYEYARRDSADFARWLIATAPLPQVRPDGQWDLGYEVCFYRDYLKRRNACDPSIKTARADGYHFKRTFDLCLFGEQAIIIIEAKVCQGFEADQNDAFRRDIEDVQRAIRRPGFPVVVVPLATTHYLNSPNTSIDPLFTGRLSWGQAAAYVAGRYQKDSRLERADSMYGA